MSKRDVKDIADVIEGQEWLPAEDIQGVVGKIFEAGGGTGQKIKNFLHGTWLGHPLHPVLTDVPIGAWTTALVLDTLDSARGREDYAKASDTIIGFGLLGATGAAVSGIADWQASGEQAPRAGLVHGLLNVGVTGLYIASLIARRRGNRSAGRKLSLIGYVLLNASAYLGGELISGQRIGVDHADREELPGAWTAVLAEAELRENKPQRVQIEELKIVLVRQGEEIYALGEVCSHLGGPLAEGELKDCSIQCPWHGSRFDLRDGSVIDGPATYSQPRFETRVHNGQIEVRMNSPLEASA